MVHIKKIIFFPLKMNQVYRVFLSILLWWLLLVYVFMKEPTEQQIIGLFLFLLTLTSVSFFYALSENHADTTLSRYILPISQEGDRSPEYYYSQINLYLDKYLGYRLYLRTFIIASAVCLLYWLASISVNRPTFWEVYLFLFVLVFVGTWIGMEIYVSHFIYPLIYSIQKVSQQSG